MCFKTVVFSVAFSTLNIMVILEKDLSITAMPLHGTRESIDWGVEGELTYP